jgi:hypothetical protein
MKFIKKIIERKVIPYRLNHPDDDNVETLNIRGYRQTDSYSCGFAAALTVVHAWFPHKSIGRFYKEVNPHPEDGTSQTKLVKVLRENHVAVSVHDDLDFDKIAAIIEDRHPIIVTVKRDGGDSHWVVIYGVGHSPRRVFIAGNTFPHRWIGRTEYPWGEFYRMWYGIGEGLICWPKK